MARKHLPLPCADAGMLWEMPGYLDKMPIGYREVPEFGEAWVLLGCAFVPKGDVGMNQGNALLLHGESWVHVHGAPLNTS